MTSPNAGSTQIPTKPLWRCVLRKSMSITEKLVLWASYCICGVTAVALAVYGALALYSISVEPIRALFLAYAWGVVVFAGSLAAMVPWYVYVGIAGVAAILVYSLLWCIAREFTEEDWDLKEPFRNIETKWYEGILWTIVYIPSWITEGNCSIAESKYAKFVVFISAYLHYRKRMKEERK